MMAQTTIIQWLRNGVETPTNSPLEIHCTSPPKKDVVCTSKVSFPVKSLSYCEAYEYAKKRILSMPSGAHFTFTGLFTVNNQRINVMNKKGTKISNRSIGGISKLLEGDGLIARNGVTTEDQGRRNHGIATRWVVL